ncbi:MAG: AbgT family transporter [Bacilli bacterium]
MSEKVIKRGLFIRFLDVIERVGNRLPDPVFIFLFLAVFVVLLSALLSPMGVTIPDPKDPTNTLVIESLLSKDGILFMFEKLVSNFINFAPFGTVLVSMLGIGLAERTGLIGSGLKAVVLSVPSSLLTATLVFCGVMSSMASDAGYVVLTPLGGVLFLAVGRHPLAGIAAAFSGVSGGFSANLLLTSLDPLLGGLTKQATELVDPAYAEQINYAMNWYFMIASVFMLTIIGTFVTEKIVEPRLGKYEGKLQEEVSQLSTRERKGFFYVGISSILVLLFFILLAVPAGSPLRGDGSFVDSPFIKNLVPVIFLMFFVPALVYGIVIGKIRSTRDVTKFLSETMGSMGSYIVLAFFAGQFVAYFTYTNIGLVLATKGAQLLKQSGISGVPLLIAFIIVCAFINLFMGSASAKWTIMAPVFVPIMMELGYSPELTQLAYRISDSSTNIITPLMSYFSIAIAFAQKYDKRLGIGTFITTMLPYSLAYLFFWILLILLWIVLDIPLGPGSPVHYRP